MMMRRFLFPLAPLMLILLLPAVSRAADTKASALTEGTALTSEDLFYTVDDPGGTPASKKITAANALKLRWLTAALGTDDTFEGDTIACTAGETVAQWDVLYPKNASGTLKWYKYDANGSDKEKPAQALATGAISADAAGTCLLSGVVRNDGWAQTSNQDEGALVYASTTAGALTLTRPATSGDEVQILGFVLEENKIVFRPSPILVEVP